MRCKNLFFGLGSSILADQSVVLEIMEMLEKKYKEDVIFESALVSSLDLVELYSGCERLIVLDTIQQAHRPLAELTFSDISSGCAGLHTENYHDSSIQETLEVAKLLGMPIPNKVELVTINVRDIYTLNVQYCKALRQELPSLFDRINKYVFNFFELKSLVVEEVF